MEGETQIHKGYRRLANGLLVSQSRYAHTKQYGRVRRSQALLRGILGRLLRDIGRKMDKCNKSQRAAIERLLTHGQRPSARERKEKNKLYSVHEPHAECISKGKAHRRYEFGCKLSVVGANRSNRLLGVHVLHSNPFDGHTLKGAIRYQVGMMGFSPEQIFVDKGYKGNGHNGSGEVNVAGRIPKNATRTFRKLRKRRTMTEPTIGHNKSYHCLDRNLLKGKEKDRINYLKAGYATIQLRPCGTLGYLERKLSTGPAISFSQSGR